MKKSAYIFLSLGYTWIAQDNSKLSYSAFKELISKITNAMNAQEWQSMMYEDSASQNIKFLSNIWYSYLLMLGFEGRVMMARFRCRSIIDLLYLDGSPSQ